MKRLIFAAAVLFITTASLAGPLRPKSIPANATWYIHLDAEAVRSSTFGKCLLAGIEEANTNEFEDMQTKLGIDLQEDVYSFTVFSLGAGPAKGIHAIIGDRRPEVAANANPDDSVVALVELSADAAESLIEHLSEVEEAYKRISIGDYKVHAMIAPASDGEEDGEGETQLLVYIKSNDDAARKTLIACDNKQLLLTAIKTLEGAAPNLTSNKDSKLSLKPRSGSLVVLSAGDIHQLTGSNGGSEIIKVGKAFKLEISEADEIVHLSASMTTKSAELAKNIADAIQGIIAIARMTMQDEDEDLNALLTLAQGLQFSADDKNINVNFEHPARELCEILESISDGASYDNDED